MVSQSQEQPEADVPPVNTGGTTTDITSEFEGVNTFEDVATSPEDIAPEVPVTEEVTTETPTETPVLESGLPLDNTAPPPPPDSGPPSLAPQTDYEQRLASLEQERSQLQQQQYDQQINQAYHTYVQELESKGYLPDQAQFVARQWHESVSNQARAARQQQEVSQYLMGQQAAAEHFAEKYNLGLSDLAQLRQHQDPQSMEAAAKNISSDREMRAELAKLRADRVPTQSFADNESTPAANNDEDRGLDRYNQGDRSPQAQSAARKAAGLG